MKVNGGEPYLSSVVCVLGKLQHISSSYWQMPLTNKLGAHKIVTNYLNYFHQNYIALKENIYIIPINVWMQQKKPIDHKYVRHL